MKRGLLSAFVGISLIATLLSVPSVTNAATPKAGVSCTKLWQTKVVKSVKYTCIRVNKKLIWNKGVSVSSPKPTVEPTLTSLPIYKGGAGGAGLAQTPALSFLPSDFAPGINLKLWVHLPENANVSLGSPGIWLKPSNSAWQFVSGQQNGTVLLNLDPGVYLVDTVEPNGEVRSYVRRTYEVSIASDRSAKVHGVLPNATGYFGLTIDRVAASSTFTPANPCQLLGQDGNGAMNQGFPARSDRLPRTGVVKALIVPLDFADVPGAERPELAYFEMANLTNQFYQKVSSGAVSFAFEILPKYVRLPFASDHYNLGSWNGGDANGYYKAAIREADPLVDYSKFDVVYFLSPRNIPSSSIAFGPAFPNKLMTEDGFIRNGTVSGADAYRDFPGAAWKWMAHETGHLFGLHDLYTVAPQPATYGSWDIMSLNWSTKAIELNSWNRFLMDWLPSDAYECLSRTDAKTLGVSKELLPISSPTRGLKSIFIPLSSQEILVIEHRATSGLDVIPLNETGVLVYTVSMTIPTIQGGWKVVRPSRSVSPSFEDAALRVGETVTVGDLRISVTGNSAAGLLVTIR